eukprot:3345380-Amphidinium_carterae.1
MVGALTECLCVTPWTPAWDHKDTPWPKAQTEKPETRRLRKHLPGATWRDLITYSDRNACCDHKRPNKYTTR